MKAGRRRKGMRNHMRVLSLTRRAHSPGLSLIPRTLMAWRPDENLIDGELDNRTPGKVTGWIRFFRRGDEPLKVDFDLKGDFHEDIRGKVIRLKNPEPSDRNESLDREGTYMRGISAMQRGSVGDITAGLPLGPLTEGFAQKLMAQNEIYWDEARLDAAEREKRRQEWTERYRKCIETGDPVYAYSNYPYIEWYSDANGRVVLELGASQVEILDKGAPPPREKTPREIVEDERKRDQAMTDYMTGMLKEISEENRKKGGDGNVFGAVM